MQFDGQKEMTWQPWTTDCASALNEEGADVWRIRVDQGPERAQCLWPYLDEPERQKAQRFHLQRDRIAYVLTRAYLRVLLGHALALSPIDIRFCHTTEGKPLLLGYTHPCFSVSHSEAYAVLVFALHHVGVDIECIRAFEMLDPSLYLSEIELPVFLELTPLERQAAFFRCWTRKEAYLKARREGITFGLDRFAVTMDSGEPPRLLWVDQEPQEPKRWHLSNLSIHPEYCGAIALEHDLQPIRYWDVDPYSDGLVERI